VISDRRLGSGWIVGNPEITPFSSSVRNGGHTPGTQKSMKSLIEMAGFGQLHRAWGLRPKCLRDEFRITVFSMPANLSGDDLINQTVRVVILLAGLCNSPGDAPLDNNVVTFSNNIVYLEFAQAL
jgi:hypothetical protein